MVEFLEMTLAGLAEVPTVAEPLTTTELCSALLAPGGGMFDPDSICATELTTVTEKAGRMLDDVQVRISRVCRGLSPGTPAE